MLSLIKHLPVELVGTNVLGYLYLKDIVLMERACGSKKSHQLFLNLIPYCNPVGLPAGFHTNTYAINWFVRRHCRIRCLSIFLACYNPCFYVENLKVDSFELYISSEITIESLNQFLEENVTYYKFESIYVNGNQNKEVMEQLSAFTGNVRKLSIIYSDNCMDWLTAETLVRWKLKEIELLRLEMRTPFVSLIVQTCTELSSIKLDSDTVNDAVVVSVAQHCAKLETLIIDRTSMITYTSLLALSERGLPLKELGINKIPNIPTADIAHRCSCALSCIRHLDTVGLHLNDQSAKIIIPYLTELTSVDLNWNSQIYCITQILAQHCHKLTKITVWSCSFADPGILSLCCVNPQLEELIYFTEGGITDTILIELIHACPHLHRLELPNETDITDVGILTLSEHCPQLKCLYICECFKITEVAVLQLLQRFHKLTRLEVSSMKRPVYS